MKSIEDILDLVRDEFGLEVVYDREKDVIMFSNGYYYHVTSRQYLMKNYSEILLDLVSTYRLYDKIKVIFDKYIDIKNGEKEKRRYIEYIKNSYYFR